MLLNDLVNYQIRYKTFWTEWTAYKHSGLEPAEIDLINKIIKALPAKMKRDKLDLYYTSNDLNKLITKLKTNYTDYQDWVILNFQWALIKTGSGNYLNFYDTAIAELAIDPQLKSILQSFGFETLSQLFSTYSDASFREAALFEKVSNYLARHNKLKTYQHATV